MGVGNERNDDFPRWKSEADPRSSAAAEGGSACADRPHWRYEQVRVLRMGERERAIQRHPASDPLGLRSKSVDADEERSGSRDWGTALAVAFLLWCGAMVALTLCIGIVGMIVR